MPVPTSSGQYRRVRYIDDGGGIYQCLWCLGEIEIRDDPNYGWNFCPKCGRSWFTRKNCRPSTIPAWAWNRYGDDDHDHPPYWNYQKATREWYFEVRSRWPDTRDEWSEWQYEYASDYKKLGEWKWAASMLQQIRSNNRPMFDGVFQFEYRVSIRNKT